MARCVSLDDGAHANPTNGWAPLFASKEQHVSFNDCWWVYPRPVPPPENLRLEDRVAREPSPPTFRQGWLLIITRPSHHQARVEEGTINANVVVHQLRGVYHG